jgi:hypothetical protein
VSRVVLMIEFVIVDDDDDDDDDVKEVRLAIGHGRLKTSMTCLH